MDDDTTEKAVDSILNQLKGFNKVASKPEEIKEMSPEDIEKFIIQKSSELISKSIAALDEYRQFMSSAPTEDAASAMAELVNASASAIETLSRVNATNKKIKASKDIKQMDIEAKIENNKRDNSTKLMMTRGDVLKLLKEPDNAIEVEAVKIS